MTDKKNEKPLVEELNVEDLDKASGGFSLNFTTIEVMKSGKEWSDEPLVSAKGEAKPDIIGAGKDVPGGPKKG